MSHAESAIAPPITADDWGTGRLDTGFPYPPAKTAGDLINQTAGIYGRNFTLIVTISAVLIFPLDALIAAFDTLGPDFGVISAGASLVQVFLFVLATGALIYGMVVREREGRAASLGEALRWGANRFVPMLGYSLLSGLLIILGMLLLIVPGVIAAVVLFLVSPIVAIEGSPARDVLQRSVAMTCGRRSGILFLLVFVAALSLALGVLVGVASFPVATTGMPPLLWALLAVGNAMGTLFAWVFTAGAVAAYLSAVAEQRNACPGCGYSLTGNVSGVCPECGTPVPATADTALPT